MPEWVPSPLYRWNLEQYEAMVASGAFTEHDRFHLINGYVVAKMTQGDPHCTADDLCGAALALSSRPAGTFEWPSPSVFPLIVSPSPTVVLCGEQSGITVGGLLAPTTSV